MLFSLYLSHDCYARGHCIDETKQRKLPRLLSRSSTAPTHIPVWQQEQQVLCVDDVVLGGTTGNNNVIGRLSLNKHFRAIVVVNVSTRGV